MDSLGLRKFFRRNYGIEVGLYSYGCFDRWRMPGPMRVGRYCSIAGSVRSVLQNHRIDALTTHPALYERRFGIVDEDIQPAGPLIIEDGVWIGHNVIILPGCKSIGRGAVVGGGSVVTQNIPPYTIYAGNPARLVRERFSREVAEAIDASGWWKLDLAGLAQLAKDKPDMVFHPGDRHGFDQLARHSSRTD